MVYSNKSVLSPRAYTLVELIVVIAILVVLSTVGFVGYSQYTASSRDGARVSDLRAIYQGIGVSISQKGIAPAPDSSISIYASTGVLLSLQGSVGETVRQAIGLESGGRDPQDGVGYTYLRFKDKKSVQLLAMFEAEEMGAKIALGENGVLGAKMAVSNPLAPAAYAATDYTDRYPSAFGKKLWVLVESGTNTPLQEVSSYTASGVNLGLPSIASGTGILVVGNTGSGVSENLSGTGVLARVLSPASLVVASSTNTTLNCDQISNSSGADGDLSECLDARTYTHPAEVITANSGNADFFDRKYSLIKMDGKWWFNENLKYPKTTDFHIPPAGTTSGTAFACPSDISSGYSPGTPKCDLVGSHGYIYAGGNINICPNWWDLPTTAQINATNTGVGWVNPNMVSGKWNTTALEIHSTYNIGGYWGSTTSPVNLYLEKSGSTWSANMSSADPTYWPINSLNWEAWGASYAAYAYTARCIKS